MLPLPWWILGVGPEEDVEEDSDNEAVDETHSATEECPAETAPTTPVSMFRTPSASPFVDVPDLLPKVVEFQTFLNIAKRRSSTKIETATPKVRKTEKRNSLVRSETEIMNKSADGQSILGCDETFGIQFDTEPARSGSPMPFNEMFNKTFQIQEDDDNIDVQCEERSSEESPKSPRNREFPLFFTSFDDTTVLFNTTIAGDIDMNEKNDAIGDWVFKSSDFHPVRN
ncbi:hypothetical protein CAEBREN_06905 [Caenorhabditis brenneri]|uniref:Uncharacterized protein n=1 Tax=Caenorhabditis brenneri TaxID=135651 RepID=G0NG91_CAEBE|nr:hypothetical protein CAEBREN_06905 [Caenorhabditis brenneri]